MRIATLQRGDAAPARPPLVRVDDVVVAVTLDATLDVRGVGARDPRLGHREARADLAVEQRLQPLFLLLGRAELGEELHVAGVGRGAVRGLGCEQVAAHELAQRRVVEVGQPGAESVVRKEEVPQTTLAGFELEVLHDRRVEVGIARLAHLRVVDVGCRVDAGVDELLQRRAQLDCLGAELEVHMCSSGRSIDGDPTARLDRRSRRRRSLRWRRGEDLTTPCANDRGRQTLDGPGVFLLLAWLAGWLLCFRVRVLSRSTRIARSSTPTVSVIVPARNEAAQLPKLLRALARQTASPDEVILVDDHSHDSTAAVARTAGVEVVTAADLPHGWTGKAWASWQGAQVARGDVLVFLDADTEPEPDLLERVVAYRSRRGGLVSVQPYHRMHRPYERLSALFNLIAVMGVGTSALWRPRRRARARSERVSPCAATTTSRTAITSRCVARCSKMSRFARRMQAAGQPVDSLGGRGAISFRMYPRGVRQLVEGWSKNFSTGAGSTPLWRVALTFLWVAGALLAGWNAWRGAIDLVAGGSGPSAIVWVAYGAYVVQMFVMLRQVGNFGVVTALLYPIPAAAFVAIFLWSLVLMARGEVHWKGRSISVRGARSR